MKQTTRAALAMSLCAITSAHAERPTDPQTELIVNLAITASVDRCHFESDSRIIGLDLLKELMLIEDARQEPAITTIWRLRSRRPQTPFKGPMTRIRENGARAVAQLWSRRRNQKGMDYAKGRAMIGKFELERRDTRAQIPAVSRYRMMNTRKLHLAYDRDGRTPHVHCRRAKGSVRSC